MVKSFFEGWLLAVAAMGIVSCNPCSGLECEHGECFNRHCRCEEGYSGALCNLRLMPRSITITSVDVSGLPSELFQRQWDSDTSTSTAYLPDVFLEIRGADQQIVGRSYETFFDAAQSSFSFKQNMNIVLEPPYSRIFLLLNDTDDDGVETIYTFTCTDFYMGQEGFPEEHVHVTGSGEQFQLQLTYKHN